MAYDGDPYRILGLARGASHRRGQACLSAPGQGEPPGRGREWSAASLPGDPGRLRAARGWTRRRTGQGPSAIGRQWAAGRGSAGLGGRTRPGPTRPDERMAAAPGVAAPADASPGRGRGAAGPADPAVGRRRGKATLGSTSYDDADAGPVEPDWSGASWYGTTSGTYWTLNPKEYADPRKHGPEYQARARRTSGAQPDADARPRSVRERPGRRGTPAPRGRATRLPRRSRCRIRRGPSPPWPAP